jgi:hypothetical protein
MSLFSRSSKEYRFNNLEELKMEKFNLQLRIQLLKEEMGRSATDVRNDVGKLALKTLAVPVAAKVFSLVYEKFVVSSESVAENEGTNWVAAIPSILKGVKQGLDIYDRIAEEYQFTDNQLFEEEIF